MSATRAGAFVGPGFEIPREEFVGTSALLALGVHIALIAALVLGVHWQSRAPQVVAVELWQAPPAPAPVPEPKPVKAEPPPPPPPPAKPEPRIEKPDIAVKAAPKPKPKPEPKPKPKPPPKAAEKPAPKPDDTRAQQMVAEALRRDLQALAAAKESQKIRDQLVADAAAARERAVFDWIDKIRTKIRGNIVVAQEPKGNPEATVLVTLLPSGDVLDAKLVIPSGNTVYDDAVMRAILKSSPLPKPDTPEVFSRNLQLKFRPKD